MPILKLAAVVVAIGCASACGVGSPSDAPQLVARSSSAITNGTADTGDPAVVAIVAAQGTACSGTLVSPYVVLTAGHCTVPDVVQGASVVFGSSVTAQVSSIPIALAVVHPQFDPSTLANDVGVVVLASAASVAPVALGSSAPDVGATLNIVGWGLTGPDAGDTGQKRQGTSVVTVVDVTTFGVGSAPSQPCEGDSGGPALATVGGVESVVGVTSHGDVACVMGATYTRVDAYLASFVQPMIAEFSPGSAAVGATCVFPAQCAGGASACVVASDDPSFSYCSTGCQHGSDCPSGMVCTGGQCLYSVPTPGAYGATCTSDADCIEGECTTTDVCALRCDPTGPACPTGFNCNNTSDIDFFCIAAPPAPAKHGGCAVAPSGRPAPFPWIAGALLLALRAARTRAGLRFRTRTKLEN